jgi:hypothetical protein
MLRIGFTACPLRMSDESVFRAYDWFDNWKVPAVNDYDPYLSILISFSPAALCLGYCNLVGRLIVDNHRLLES